MQPLVKKILRGAYNIRASLLEYSFTWDIGAIIKPLLDFDTISSMLNLSMRVATHMPTYVGKGYEKSCQ